jgi:hypothetical protein
LNSILHPLKTSLSWGRKEKEGKGEEEEAKNNKKNENINKED